MQHKSKLTIENFSSKVGSANVTLSATPQNLFSSSRLSCVYKDQHIGMKRGSNYPDVVSSHQWLEFPVVALSFPGSWLRRLFQHFSLRFRLPTPSGSLHPV